MPYVALWKLLDFLNAYKAHFPPTLAVPGHGPLHVFPKTECVILLPPSVLSVYFTLHYQLAHTFKVKMGGDKVYSYSCRQLLYPPRGLIAGLFCFYASFR